MLNYYSHDKNSSREGMTMVWQLAAPRGPCLAVGRQELCWAQISWSPHYHKPSRFETEKYLQDWPFLIASPSPTTFTDLIESLTLYAFFIYTGVIKISIFQTFHKIFPLPTSLACFCTLLFQFSS